MAWKLSWRKQRDRELDDEIAHDLELDAEERVRAGAARDEADHASRRDFGNVLSVSEATRAAWGWNLVEVFAQDFRYAWRMMRKSPGFTLVAVLSLALGIGVNSAMFSLADAMLFRPLAVARPSEIMTIKSTAPNTTASGISYPDYLDFRDGSRSFRGIAAFHQQAFGFSRSATELPQMRLGMLVSGNFFEMMGVTPVLGRAFRPEEDDVPGRDPVVVLGHDFWQKQLGAPAAVLGSKVRLDGLEFTVIGVAPEQFTGMDQYIRPAVFIPLAMVARLSPEANLLKQRKVRTLGVKGRLAPGITAAQAQAELAGIARNLARAYPDSNREHGVAVETEFQTRIDDDPEDGILVAMLLGLAAMVLLVACANIANLLLSRAHARTREIALRLAVGAGRGRLVRQLLVESLAIALAGGVASLAVAYAGVYFISRLQVPSDLPIVIAVRLDHRVWLFSLAITLLSTVLFGLAPALQASRLELASAIRREDSDRARKRRFWGRNALVVGQVALSLILLVVAAMLARGFGALLANGPGFRTDHLVMMSFDPTLVRYQKTQAQQFYKELMDRARAMPGVRSATLTSTIPFAPSQGKESIVPEGSTLPKNTEKIEVLANSVDERYFDAMDVPIVQGRGFRATDLYGGRRVAVINQAMAKHYWPNSTPAGKRFRLGGRDGAWVEVVGVARTIKYTWIGEPPVDYLYLAQNEWPSGRMTLVVESLGDAAGMVAPLRQLVLGLDANQPVYDVRTIEDFYKARASSPHIINEIVSAMGLIGLALAMIGLYGLTAYNVARRTREIGIRMAIGADRASVMRMVLREGLRLCVAGLAIGIAGSLAAEKIVMALFGATHRDVGAYLVVAPILLAVTMLAVWAPAWRASRVDPMRALRCE